MNKIQFKSRKEVSTFLSTKGIDTSNWTEEKWLSINKGQAEIHMMTLAEAMWDAMNESTPKELKAGDWHIPFIDKIDIDEVYHKTVKSVFTSSEYSHGEKDYLCDEALIKISTAMAARTSYTIVGDEKEFGYEKQIELHDRLTTSGHYSPFEHCARVMTDAEYQTSIKGKINIVELENNILVTNINNIGWCRNYRGFIQYREILEDAKQKE